MNNTTRSTFGSSIGMIAAATGSAVGLGNIWRFPSQTADGGGAIFLLVYLMCILFFGIPLMVAEFSIGRASRANSAGAFGALAPGTPWRWVGRLGVLTGFVIMGFYMVVCGWTLDYFFQSVSGTLHVADDYGTHFSRLLANKPKQIAWAIGFTLLTAFFVLFGVRKGIERSAKVMMPILFLLLVVLAVRSLTLPGAGAGIDFLFKPQFAHVKPTVFLDAMGQAFFSLSIGMGCMITYASYFKDDTNLASTAAQVSVLDSLVALLAGLVIFPSAFALTAHPDTIVTDLVAGGPGLLFITVPELFKQMPLAEVWSSMFFLLLGLAALTSTISLMEVVTAYLHEEFQVNRKKSALLVSCGVVVLSVISSVSAVFFNAIDFVSAKVMLPVGGLFVSLFVGWYLNKALVEAQLTNNGKQKFNRRLLGTYCFILKYIAPAAIVLIFLYGLWS